MCQYTFLKVGTVSFFFFLSLFFFFFFYDGEILHYDFVFFNL